MSFLPLDPEVRQAVIDDLKSGEFGRNEIARRNYVGNATVTRIAQEEGLDPSLGNTQTQQATRAVAIETKARRERIKVELLGDVERLRVRAWSKWSKEVVTKDGIEELTADLPPLPEVQAAYRSIGIALDSFFKLEALDTAGAGSTQDARDFLTDLHSQLSKVREDFEASTGVPFDSSEAKTIISGEVVSDASDSEGTAE